jgi:di/tricarboxylate transporter
MGIDAWLTLAVVGFLLTAMIRNLAPPDLLFLGATTFLAITQVITPNDAFAGFSNSAMLTVAGLFVVAVGLRDTGLLDDLGHHLLGGVRTERAVMLRLAAVTIPLSAFLNNTPIVAMFLPIVVDWCRRNHTSPSRLLIPLSFLTILGGTCTLIGTSTNLVIHGLMIKNGMPGLGLFEIAVIGVPYSLIGTAYLLTAGRWLLPERKDLLEQLGESRREYLVEMEVQAGSRLIGKSVEANGLRRLPGLFLIEIDRAGSILTPVGPEDIIQENDHLVFTGIVSSIIELEKIPGLIPVADPNYESESKQQLRRRLCEAVISVNSPLVGKSIRETDFRAAYGAAVVAVHRSGKRVKQKIGDIELQPGDTLLLQTGPHFLRAYRHDPAFYLVSNVDDWRPLRRHRAVVAGILFAALIAVMTSGRVPLELATTMTAVLMVATGCVSTGDARRSIEWQVLITIAAAFGVGIALEKSGAAGAIAMGLVEMTRPFGPLAAVAVIYLIGSVVTELITNNAVAVLMFPFCIETARLYGVSPKPFLMALLLSASASFMTPIGYQTNMMVYGPGGYRFGDFLRVGGPLNLLLWLTAVLLIPVFWPF